MAAQSNKLNPPVDFGEFAIPSYEDWKQSAIDSLKGAPFEKKMFTPTYEGITLEPIYTADSVKKLKESKDSASFPGAQDYLRGTNSVAAAWQIAQGIDATKLEEAGALIAEELKRGATAIHPVLDSATLHGEDIPAGGRGVSLNSLDSIEKLFADADPTQHELNVDCGASALPVLGMIAAWAQKNEKSPAALTGCVGADPIAALALDGKLPRSLASLYDEMAETIKWAEANKSPLRTILLRGSVYANAGADAVTETACVLAELAAVIRAMAERGIDPSVTCSHLRVNVVLGANFFMSIARLRALRVLFAHVARAFGSEGDSLKVNVIAENSPFTMTSYDPYVNILRSATQSFSGAIAGVDAMNLHPFDSTVRPSTEQSRRIARNQQVMLQTEFNLDATIDPAGGSWYVETLTRQVENKVWEAFQKIEGDGGIVAALKSGSVQGKISAVLDERLKKLATRSDRAVGVNMYANMTETPLAKPACECEKTAAAISASIESIKSQRCPNCIAEALKCVKTVDDAAKAFAASGTLSEVCGALSSKKEADETAENVAPLAAHRLTEQFEALRAKTEREIAKGNNVRIFLANMGPIPQHKARADFSTGFFEVAHFEVLKNDGFATVEECAEAACASKADAAVICSTDAAYPEIVPPLAKLIKQKCPGITLFLAGAPAPEMKQTYLDSGVDDFIHVKSNCLAVLAAMQQKKGM